MLITLWNIEYSEKNPIKKLYFEISFKGLSIRIISYFLIDFRLKIKSLLTKFKFSTPTWLACQSRKGECLIDRSKAFCNARNVRKTDFLVFTKFPSECISNFTQGSVSLNSRKYTWHGISPIFNSNCQTG